MQLVSNRNKCFFRIKIIILFLLIKSLTCYSQETSFVRFIWTDNALKTSDIKNIYIVSDLSGKKDTLFPARWNPMMDDTISFYLKQYKNPVHLELAVDTNRKKSNQFNLIPLHTYNLTEFSDSLVVKPRPLIFDNFNPNAQLLYSFLIKLSIELLIAILIAAFFRLPARLLFFVLVANIMSFPIVYINFLPVYIKELITIALEALFIFGIGWKRFKFTKALMISLILNILRFGIYKVLMLIIKII
jgi:hypothetical protein